MKKQLIAVVSTTLLSGSVMAQSAFEGFYGQLGTGYESNTVSSLNAQGINPAPNPNDSFRVSNQNFGGVPAVIGLGYNFSAAPKWLVGIGADYSAISQKSSNYALVGINGTSSTQYNATLQTSNRFNIFVTPGYEIDKDKLVYLKAGYSSVSLKQNYPTYTSGGTYTGPLSYQSQSKTVSGYIVGLGYKQMIANGFYGFGEANYMSYSSASLSTNDGLSGASYYGITNNPSLSTYQFLVGVGYKF